ncbi:MAG TPA: GNAT family N-acetyltransferase [Woeseiaceae bacterium]|nr:GNAT family N-acetyltransferase [Woeseiaceae bacterium]
MAHTSEILVYPRIVATEAAAPAPSATSAAAMPDVELFVSHDLGEVESEWRRFEQTADCTVFQSFDWLACWHRHIGKSAGTVPAIVLGRRRAGDLLFILPLATRRSQFLTQLTFLGRDLCDYNAPLLAPDFDRVIGPHFPCLWLEVLAMLQQNARQRHHLVLLDKMPERIGGQQNPFLRLDVSLNPSGAYLTSLSGDWDSFYAAKRSSTTRRRDRSKRKRLAESGDVRMVTPREPEAIADTLRTLIAQKRRAFARMGVADMFARPGVPEFFLDLATGRESREMTHVSRLEVGATSAATNFGVVFRGGYYHVLASYDEGPLSRFGPGAAHLHDLMRYALESGCTLFDFTIGDEPYKRDWCDVELKLYDHVAAATSRGWIAAKALSAAWRAKRAIKQSRLWPAAMRARAAVSAIRRSVFRRPR